MLRWTWEQNIELPRAASSDGSRVEWVPPNYRALMDMLRNPKYAGVYVHPRYQRETRTTPSGKVQKHRRLSDPDEWTSVLHDHHPAYITFAQHQANQQKIAMNAQRYKSSSGSVNRGASLLAGLVECRRCGHKMQVSYSSQGRVSYDCRNGRRQRDGGGVNCFRFSADELERQLSEQVLYAVSPAGVAAAGGPAGRSATLDRRDLSPGAGAHRLRACGPVRRRETAGGPRSAVLTNPSQPVSVCAGLTSKGSLRQLEPSHHADQECLRLRRS